jgi:hypothetical protein
MIETLGQARQYGWGISARCLHGRADHEGKSSRECHYRFELDVETLLWTPGHRFLISRLSQVLKCPSCGSRKIAVMLDIPQIPNSARMNGL